MDKLEMCRLLPVEPPKGLVEWTRKKHGRAELGAELCVFTSERLPVAPTFEEVLEHNSFASRKKEWGAVCNCTACGEEFITQKEPGERAIRLVAGEDGWNYTIDIGETVDHYMGIEVNREGDTFFCPLCGSEVELIHAGKLNGSRKKQLMVVSVENVHGYAAVIYWMVYRYISEYGISDYGAYPADAFVLTEKGTVVRFAHALRGGFYGNCEQQLTTWKAACDNRDTIDKVYHDWGSINNRKQGADFYPVFPSLEGTTGEKTALEEYLKADGYRPVEYLKWWRRQPNIENLCRQGQAKLVVDILKEAYRYSADINVEANKYIDLSKKKPNEMLTMSKEEFRWVRDNKQQITCKGIRDWKRYGKAGGKVSFLQFAQYCNTFGENGISAALAIMERYQDADIDKIARYLEKRGLRHNEAGILLDTREGMRKLYNRQLTQEELWPKHLHETHDRVNRMLLERKSREAAERLREEFAKVLEKYGHLQWNDGELAVILPKDNGELVYEGDVLRHCVGGYGSSHVEGSSVIFFIRHYRRPERPYYTLSIDMRGKPKECQLHGYGNERHGKNKQYPHQIPKKVRDFCDRWENEVLLTWYAEQQKNKEDKTA